MRSKLKSHFHLMYLEYSISIASDWIFHEGPGRLPRESKADCILILDCERSQRLYALWFLRGSRLESWCSNRP